MRNQLHRAEIDLTLDLHSLRCDPELKLVLGKYPRDFICSKICRSNPFLLQG